MRQKIWSIAITLSLFCTAYAGEAPVHYLVAYGQVWGFLKYFHPYPGTVNWDERLIADYPRLKQASAPEFETLVDELVQLCPLDGFSGRDTTDLEMMPRVFSWMEADVFTASQRDYMHRLLVCKPRFRNAYVSINWVGSANFTTEKNVPVTRWEEAVLFLSITRYWNAVNYFFPYRSLIPGDWNDVYREQLPSFLKASGTEEYQLNVMRLSNAIADGHGFVNAEEDYLKAYRFPPFYAASVSDGTYITWVANDSVHHYPVRRGDKVLEIEGMTTDERWDWVNSYFASSNDYYARGGYGFFRWTKADSLALVLLRDGDTLRVTVPTFDEDKFYTRKPRKDGRKQPYSLRTDSLSGKAYMYINMGLLEEKDVDARFRRMLRNVDHLVVDSRNYPRWTIIKLSACLLKGKRYFARAWDMSADYPGSFRYHYTQKVGGHREYHGHVYILVDAMTMSQAEYTVMALQQHPRAITIGGQTAGADGNVTSVPLPYGVSATFSGIGIEYADGGPCQQVGVRRDIACQQDAAYIRDWDNDRILHKALELIRQQK